jgi:phosphatidylglycerophosphate synthase
VIPLSEVVARSRRPNHEENVWIYPVSGRIAKYFSWLFLNLGMSANQVTVLFWLCGVGSAAAYLFDRPGWSLVGLLLFRLHILFDVCDGEVARFRGTISRYGVYWDQLIHVTTYPLVLGCLGLGRLLHGAEVWVAAAAMLAMTARGAEVALKNIHLRTRYQAGEPYPQARAAAARPAPGARRAAASLLVRLASLDAFLLFHAFAGFLPPAGGIELRDALLAAYALAFLAALAAKALLIPRRGGLPMRKDLR